MNKALRTLGISVLLLTVGASTAACGSSDRSSASSENQITTISSALTAPAETVHADPSERTPESVAASLNHFFASVSKETTFSLTADSAKSAPVPSTPEEKSARMHKAYPEALKHLDEASLGIKKEAKLIASLSMLGIMSATVTAEAEGIIVNGDNAVVHQESLKVSTENTVRSGEGGSITLKHTNGAWLITDYTTESSSK